MSIHIEAAKHGLFILHQPHGKHHYCIAARKHPTSSAPEVCGVSDACRSRPEAEQQAFKRAVDSLKNYKPNLEEPLPPPPVD